MKQFGEGIAGHIQQLFLLAFLLIFLTACKGIEPPPTHYTIGVLNRVPILELAFEGFKSGMTELGYIEGENVTYIYEGAFPQIEDLRAASECLSAAEVDLILSISTEATQAIQEIGTDIPVIFTAVFDPIAAGLIRNLQRPNGNLTGTYWGISEERRLEWLLHIAPMIKRIYIPYNPDDQSPVLSLARIQKIADSHDVELIIREARTLAEIESAVIDIPNDIDAILMLPDSLVSTQADSLIKVALERRVPFSTPSSETVKNGALFSFGLDITESGHQAARLADQVLQGIEPGELPVETAEFALTINLQTATAIGLEIPNEILLQADEIIRDD
jgi:putative ABC transport system substrate-binding protein